VKHGANFLNNTLHRVESQQTLVVSMLIFVGEVEPMTTLSFQPLCPSLPSNQPIDLITPSLMLDVIISN
jgi:hypothetical protein